MKKVWAVGWSIEDCAQRLLTHIFNRYLYNEKTFFADNSRAEATIIAMKNISYILKLLSGHFYGQPFIKTFLGPLGYFLVIVTYIFKYRQSTIVHYESTSDIFSFLL